MKIPTWRTVPVDRVVGGHPLLLSQPAILFLVLTAFSLCWLFPSRFDVAAAQDRKLTPGELVSRHLEAIGSAESRAKVSSRVVSGNSKLVLLIGGAANLDGTAMIVSSGPKFRFGMQFSTPDYTGEDMAFDGSRAATGLLPQGRRSPLSNFLNSQSQPLKEGLMCGVLSTAWPLLRMDQLQPRLEYRGLKKIDQRQLHELSYRARKGGDDLKVLLYFDPETWRHVGSKYSFEIGASIGTREVANMNTETYFSVTESFDNFRLVDGLTLPHQYKLKYSAEGKGASVIYDWTLIISRISHSESFDSQLFTIK